jgi:hypothetical protein
VGKACSSRESVKHGTGAERGGRGQEDLAARGEIRRLAEDGQRRRRLPGTLSLVRRLETVVVPAVNGADRGARRGGGAGAPREIKSVRALGKV